MLYMFYLRSHDLIIIFYDLIHYILDNDSFFYLDLVLWVILIQHKLAQTPTASSKTNYERRKNIYLLLNTRSKSRCYFDSEKATRGQCKVRFGGSQAAVPTSFPLSSAHQLSHVGVETLRLLRVGKVQTHLACLQHTHIQRTQVTARHKAHFPGPKPGRFPMVPRKTYRRHQQASTYLMVCCRPSRSANRPTRLQHKDAQTTDCDRQWRRGFYQLFWLENLELKF